MSRKLEPTAYAGAAAVTEMLVLLTVGIVAQGGFYKAASDKISDVSMFYDGTPVGIIGGMIEGAIVVFVFIFIFAYFYNLLISTFHE